MQNPSEGYASGSARVGEQLPVYSPPPGVAVGAHQQPQESGQYFITQSIQNPTADIGATQLDTPAPQLIADARPNVISKTDIDNHRESAL